MARTVNDVKLKMDGDPPLIVLHFEPESAHVRPATPCVPLTRDLYDRLQTEEEGS